MKTLRVTSGELEVSAGGLSPEHYITQHKAQKKAYWRRLSRLVRCHYLPHHICELLSITSKQFVDDIKALDDKGETLSYDPRQDVAFKTLTPPSALSTNQQQTLIDDNSFYQEKGLSMAERARLLMLTRSRLRDLQAPLKHHTLDDKASRDSAIVQIWQETKNKRNLKSQLAKSFGLSRKSIDLILQKHGIEPLLTSKHKKPLSRHSKKESIISLHKQLKQSESPPESLITHIAQKLGISTSYVHKVMREYQA